MRRTRFLQRAFLAGCAAGWIPASNAAAASFVDEHSDGSLSGWTSQGRSWTESGGKAGPICCTSNSGFLMNNNTVSSDGTLEVKLVADQWNGQKGGVVFRWSSAANFFMVALQPGNSSSNSLRFCRNTLDASQGQVVAQAFPVGTTATLKIVMKGSRFDIYVDGVLRGTVNDASNPTGRIGYGYAGEWNDYIDFDRISWTESVGALPADPSGLTVAVASASRIDLSWKDMASNETGYSVERKIGSGAFTEVARLSANATGYSSTGLSENTLYTYRVRAFNASGYSGYSTQAYGRTPLAPLVQRTRYRALVLVYDPILGARYGNKRVSEHYGYRNVDTLCKQYIDMMYKASGGQVQFEIAQKHVLDELPPEVDPNVQFTRDSCIQQWDARKEVELGKADYKTIAEDPRMRIIERVNSGDVDFVWVFGTPGSGFWEASMAGPGAFWVNGGEHPEIGTNRKFVFFGFGRESHQGVGFMAENTAHMMENIMGRHLAPNLPKRHAVPVWNTFDIANATRSQQSTFLDDWNYFILSDAANFDPKRTSRGNAQLGLSHYPPTAIHNYDWGQQHDLGWHMFKSYGGTWTEGGLGVSVASGAANRAFAFDGTRNEVDWDPSTEYPMPVLASDFQCVARVSVSNGAARSSAGFLLRGSNQNKTLAELRGYYVGIDAFSDRIRISKFDNGEQILGEASLPIWTGRAYELVIRAVGDTISVDTAGGTGKLVSVVDGSFKSGGFGYASFGTAASFGRPTIKALVLSGADSWYSYPDLSGPARRISAEMEYEGQMDEFGSMDHYYAWMYEHLPKLPALLQYADAETGKRVGKYLGTWWPYLFDFNQFTGDTISREVVFASRDMQAPASVTGLKASIARGFVRLDWAKASDNVGTTRYEIKRNGVVVKNVRDGLAFVDRDVVDETEYTYSVVAVDGSGNRSAAANVTVAYVLSELINGDFERSNIMWGRTMWNTANSTLAYVPQVGVGGSQAVEIRNDLANDAAWTQEVQGLEPGAWYRLSGWIKGQGIVNRENGTRGASLSVMDTWTSTEDLVGTFDWTKVSVTFQAPQSGEVVVGCRLGHWSNTVTGKAWFDNVILTRE